MKRIDLTITAESPLAIGRRKPGGSVSEAENYIPGTVIRGAIAGQILQQAQPESQDFSQNGGAFQALFLDEQAAIFQNAYPAIYKVSQPNEDLDEIVEVTSTSIRVLPATAVSSKADSGFKSSKGNGVFDTLIDRFCADAYNYPYDPSCPKDLGRVEPFSGFYSGSEDEFRTHTVEKRLLTRVGINRRRATAEEQVLYSIEVLNETHGKQAHPTVYHSAILIENDKLAEPLAQFIEHHHFRLGGSASRGLGKVAIAATVQTPESNVKSRIDQFNGVLKERWQAWSIFGKPTKDLLQGRTYFTLDLQSEAILTEQWRRTTVISSTILQEFAGVSDPSLQLHVAYSSYDYRSGWNAAWGLMKDVDLVTNMGGVYLFSTQNSDLWYSALKDLELRGVGDRTSEGFGQIEICHEFHTVFRERAV